MLALHFKSGNDSRWVAFDKDGNIVFIAHGNANGMELIRKHHPGCSFSTHGFEVTPEELQSIKNMVASDTP